MKKILTLMIIALFLTSFTFAYNTKITPRAIDNPSENSNAYANDNADVAQNEGEESQTQTQELTQAQIQEIKQERKRLRIQEGECAEECTCTGANVKCTLEDGSREMTVTAGNSGNIIIQVQGIDGTTSVVLYHHNGKIYGEFEEGTQEVVVMPDEVVESVEEEAEVELEDEEITLDENGKYQYKAKRRVKLFGFIKTRANVRARINSETGELEKFRNAWWSFLASDDTSEEPEENEEEITE